ncbi:hypothetical protein IU487_22690 [Nocardia puris]|uniref:hypothetical protein n=1 Tax=Nocardia puris TaxID=208602 RepID=UPI0018952C92|nr:hypothetical protein [Nocardia puris]MBF6213828.1 hypothetical protein [Nocardia puris]
MPPRSRRVPGYQRIVRKNGRAFVEQGAVVNGRQVPLRTLPAPSWLAGQQKGKSTKKPSRGCEC